MKIIDKFLVRDRVLSEKDIKNALLLLGAAKTLARAISTYEELSERYHNQGQITNIYGRWRKLQVVRWNTGILAGKSAMDFGVGRTWISEGIPETATQVAVAIETAPNILDTNFCIIIEDSTFKPLEWEEVIPELTVLTVDVQKSMDKEKDMHKWN